MQNPSEPLPSLPAAAAPEAKSIFESETFWGAISSAAVAIAPAITSLLDELLRTGKISPFTMLKIPILLATTGITIMGRIEAETPVYTPAGLPGPDKPADPTQAKSIFESKTFWGAVSTAVVAISPTLIDLLDELQKTGKIDPGKIFHISVVLATTGLTIMGRIGADIPVHTPPGFPGPDRPVSS
ncbi:hypothetical protein [Phormidesmis priestleyi]|uniref:hypothetical protein n=1 Tax=Phormidesmis priestleyi TaxID=268141 RepID=UPI000934E796|nr:hypothetical protein [Phormidesmis priestleyi]